MKASVLITVYNCWEIANKAINQHIEFGGDFVTEIIVIDDCSTEQAPHFVSEKVKIIRNEINLGYVKSVNKGLQMITSDLVILFDADAVPLIDYAVMLKHIFVNNEKIGAIGFRTIDSKGQATGISEPEPTPWTLLLGQKLYSFFEKFESKSHITIFSCAIVVRNQVVQQLKGFDETFDFLDADTDFSMRLTRSGWELKIIDALKALHEGSGSPQNVSKRVLRHYINRHKLLVKHGKWSFPILFKIIVLTRLTIEYITLQMIGRILFTSKDVLKDKITGRKNVLDYVYNNY